MQGERAERRSYQHSRLACYTRITRSASARPVGPGTCVSGGQHRMFQSGAPCLLLSLDDPVRGSAAPAA